MIKRFRTWLEDFKQRRKEDFMFWFILGYGVAFIMVIVEDMMKIALGIM